MGDGNDPVACYASGLLSWYMWVSVGALPGNLWPGDRILFDNISIMASDKVHLANLHLVWQHFLDDTNMWGCVQNFHIITMNVVILILLLKIVYDHTISFCNS